MGGDVEGALEAGLPLDAAAPEAALQALAVGLHSYNPTPFLPSYLGQATGDRNRLGPWSVAEVAATVDELGIQERPPVQLGDDAVRAGSQDLPLELWEALGCLESGWAPCAAVGWARVSWAEH